MKYLAILLFIGSLSAEKTQLIKKYSLSLKTDSKQGDWPIKAELNLKLETDEAGKIEFEKKGENIKSISCTVIQPENGTCTYNETDGTLNFKEKVNELSLKYDIEETKCLKFWKSEDKKLKILAGNLKEGPSQVLLHAKSGGDSFKVTVDGKEAETWRTINTANDLAFLGGDVDAVRESGATIYLPKDHFKISKNILIKFFEELKSVTGKNINLALSLVPINLQLPDLEDKSGLAEAMNTGNSLKFSKQYSSFVETVVRHVFEFKKKFWWTEALITYLPSYLISKHNSELGKIWSDQFYLDVIQNQALEKYAFKIYPTLQKDGFLPGKGAALMYFLNKICQGSQFSDGVKKCLGVTPALDTVEVAFEKCFPDPGTAKNFFDKYVKQQGYPVLHVEEKKKGNFSLHQEKFSWSEGSKSNEKWTVPLFYGYNGGVHYWLSEEKGYFTVSPNDTPLPNRLLTGYCRVNHPEEVWNAIIEYKNKTDLNPYTRAQIINDIFSLSKSTVDFSHAVPDYRRAMKLVSYLSKENDYLPVKAAFNAFEFLESSLTDDLNSKFQVFVKTIVSDLYNNFPIINKTSLLLLEREVGFWACKLGIESCIKHAENKLKSVGKLFEISDTGLLDWEVPLCVGIRKGNEDLWKKLWEKMENMKGKPEELSLLINVLGCTKNKKNLESLIKKVEEDNNVDACHSILRGNPENVKTVLEYLVGRAKNPLMFHKSFAKVALTKANKDNLHFFTKLDQEWKDGEISGEFKEVIDFTNQWNKKKLSVIRDSLSSGESKTTPIALIVLFSALLPFLNSIFSH